MNLIIIDKKDINEDLTVELSSRQSNHCISVLEINIGSKLNVGVKNFGKGTATVTKIKKGIENDGIIKYESISNCSNIEESYNQKNNKSRKSISVINYLNNFNFKVTIKLDAPIHTGTYEHDYPLIDLLIALPRPKIFEKVLQNAVTLGVGRIIFVCTDKSEKSYLNSSKMKRESIDEIVQLGLEQASKTLCPDVYVYASWKSFIKHLRNHFFNKESMIGIVADIDGRSRISEIGLQRHNGPIILAIGPEGGWTKEELDNLISEGFAVVNMGDRILKVETAVLSLYSKAELLLTDPEVRRDVCIPKRDKYWHPSRDGPGITVLPVKDEMPESTEESSLLLKIQKFENKIPGEKLESPKIERGKSLDIFLYGTPIRKRRDIECISKKSNRLLSTPKKYFGEDILNSVPRNIGRFKNYTNGFSIDGCINTNTDDILHGIILKKNEIEQKHLFCQL
ncbi:transmembrane domain-containing protein [Cryptosporidium canis]|nr:transmembrane domain-containing protein [Cryptosporidium canis]